MTSKLKPEVLELLIKFSGLKKSTLRSRITRIKSKHPGLTSNAAAHVIAQSYDKSLLQKLDEEDKISLRGYTNTQTIYSKFYDKHQEVKNRKKKNEEKSIINYQSDDYFIKEHIKETNRAYNAKCYTSVFILVRKIIENLVVSIIKKKFSKEPELVLNTSTNRNLDFSVILKNLYEKRTQFSHDGKGAIERLNQLVKPFKDDANAKAHSWFHIVKSPKEIDDWQLDTIIELVKKLESEVGF